MNQTINEQLSALMDGELERDQTRFLLKRMDGDSDLSQRWARYHVVRQTLRRQEIVFATGFVDRVMGAIEAEPARHAYSRHAWMRWGAGGAIAASVAAAALMLVQPQQAGPGPAVASKSGGSDVPQIAAIPSRTSPAAVTVSAPATSTFRPPLLAPNAPIETAPASFGSDLVQPMATDPRLQSYLIRHYQAMGASGQTAVVPYVLLAVPQRDSAPQAAEPTVQNR